MTSYLWIMPTPDLLSGFRKWQDDRREMEEWCRENINGAWASKGGTFEFYTEQDYVMFLLRWA